MQMHVYDSPWAPAFLLLWQGFSKENPRRPFALWQFGALDADAKDLIAGLTNFDPALRITADQALAHKWFDGV